MNKKVVVLIDGQNLFYSLKELKIVEKNIHWSNFFAGILSDEDELIRSYWFRPEKILDTYYTKENVTYQVVRKHYKQHLKDFTPDLSNIIKGSVRKEIEDKVNEALDWLANEKRRFSNIQYNYDQLALSYGNIEFVKTGIVKVNPYLQEYVGEKGVDISLAVKMISLSVQEKCDKIILISGDYDYAEAIKFVKDQMMKIELVKFHKGYPPKNRSVSRDLAVLADRVIDVYESELKEKYRG